MIIEGGDELGSLDSAVMGRYVVGRRKSSTARVLFRKGSGKIMVNGREFGAYFKLTRYMLNTRRPLDLALEQDARFADIDIHCLASGGGTTGQSDAIRLAIARKLVALSSHLRIVMRSNGLLTCDSRKIESKKYGMRGARRRFQYAKR